MLCITATNWIILTKKIHAFQRGFLVPTESLKTGSHVLVAKFKNSNASPNSSV